jgi:hypothetical protein
MYVFDFNGKSKEKSTYLDVFQVSDRYSKHYRTRPPQNQKKESKSLICDLLSFFYMFLFDKNRGVTVTNDDNEWVEVPVPVDQDKTMGPYIPVNSIGYLAFFVDTWIVLLHPQ